MGRAVCVGVGVRVGVRVKVGVDVGVNVGVGQNAKAAVSWIGRKAVPTGLE